MYIYVHLGSIKIMEKNMESTVVYLMSKVWGFNFRISAAIVGAEVVSIEIRGKAGMSLVRRMSNKSDLYTLWTS